MTRMATLSLLASTALVAGVGIALAGMNSPAAPPQTANRDYSFGRFSGRLLAAFDLNRDGKITRDEMNKGLGQQFAHTSTNGGMNLAQFTASRQADFRKRSDQTFHRVDWNGDGKLSLDEFVVQERVRFIAMDRKGSGVIFCSGRRTGAAKTEQKRKSSSRGSARAAFCNETDLNKDGRVTRAEFDKVTTQRFASAAKGGTLSADAYYNIVVTRFRQSTQGMFARLDSNHDGKLSLAEYGAPQMKMFARADKNRDGAVTADEMSRRGGRSHKPARTPG